MVDDPATDSLAGALQTARPARLDALPLVDANNNNIHGRGKLFTAVPSRTDYMEQWVECFVGLEMS
jgi:hypothetical protein